MHSGRRSWRPLRNRVAGASGIGVLAQNGSDLRSVSLHPNATSSDGWRMNTVDGPIGPAGDFFGVGGDELLAGPCPSDPVDTSIPLTSMGGVINEHAVFTPYDLN